MCCQLSSLILVEHRDWRVRVPFDAAAPVLHEHDDDDDDEDAHDIININEWVFYADDHVSFI